MPTNTRTPTPRPPVSTAARERVRRPLTRTEAIEAIRSGDAYRDAPPSVRAWVDAMIEHGEAARGGERAGSGDKMDKTCVK